MAIIKFKNNAYSTFAGGISNVATSFACQAGHGDRFPVIAAPDIAYITFEDSGGNREVVKVTARGSGSDTFTIVRAQDGTTARAWLAGDVVEQRIVALELDRFESLQNIDASDSKATPVDADLLGLIDSAASNALKKLTWANLKATLKTYFDTLYAKVGAVTSGGITMTTARLLGRSTAATGAIEEIALGTGLSFTGTTLNVAYDAAASQAEMEAGTEAALRAMSPLRIAQAIAALGGAGATSQAFTSNGTWTRPAGCVGILIIGWGGGCGGGGAYMNLGWAGGSGNGSKANYAFVASPAASYAVTIGAGGAGAGAVSGGNYAEYGAAGGNTTVGAVFTAVGASLGGDSAIVYRNSNYYSQNGGIGPGGVGAAGVAPNATGLAAAANTGAGGSGGHSDGSSSTSRSGGAGGSGYALIVEFY